MGRSPVSQGRRVVIQSHPYFELPEDPNTKVWRYLSFTKFVSLLHTQALHFARSDQFDDAFEGTVPESAVTHLRDFFARTFPNADELAQQYIQAAEAVRLFTYINC